jgi:DNA-binding response OmpR family regulator
MSGRAVPSGPPARLLLADSDPSLRRVLHLALEAHGYRVTLADTATAALDIAADDALTKPFGIDQLLDRLQALRTPAHPPPGHDQQQATGADPPWMPS